MLGQLPILEQTQASWMRHGSQQHSYICSRRLHFLVFPKESFPNRKQTDSRDLVLSKPTLNVFIQIIPSFVEDGRTMFPNLAPISFQIAQARVQLHMRRLFPPLPCTQGNFLSFSCLDDQRLKTYLNHFPQKLFNTPQLLPPKFSCISQTIISEEMIGFTHYIYLDVTSS